MQDEMNRDINIEEMSETEASVQGMHTHVDENGNTITHSHHDHDHHHEHDKDHIHDHHDCGEHHDHEHHHNHGAGHTHAHGHEHPNAKAVSNRLARAIGHLEKVKQMVDEGEDCAQVLIQLAAIRSAINNAGKVLLMDHVEHCLVEAVQNGDMEMVKELNEAIQKFVK